ncbi:MAG: CHAD domain-containing protein [Gemmatimonadetes bacterium]|nr:CHAD domain-containing protein [Gemmatimonadota bacterium]
MSAPLAPAIADALAQRLDAFRGAAEASGDTGDDEAAHRVRVTARRLHAALLLWRPLLALPAAARPGVLRRVEQRFGARRDLDVLRARVEALRTTERPLADVIATLRAGTDDAEERGRLVLRRRSTRRMIAALTEWIAAPAWTPLATLSPPHLLPWLIAPTASRVLVHPGGPWRASRNPTTRMAARFTACADGSRRSGTGWSACRAGTVHRSRRGSPSCTPCRTHSGPGTMKG